jgi:hypothetical protein
VLVLLLFRGGGGTAPPPVVPVPPGGHGSADIRRRKRRRIDWRLEQHLDTLLDVQRYLALEEAKPEPVALVENEQAAVEFVKRALASVVVVANVAELSIAKPVQGPRGPTRKQVLEFAKVAEEALRRKIRQDQEDDDIDSLLWGL